MRLVQLQGSTELESHCHLDGIIIRMQSMAVASLLKVRKFSAFKMIDFQGKQKQLATSAMRALPAC